ncbi:unnamed protein product [Meloidogyne enterolobii]|uniref:Uncharacterized protein n=1 Tax=Meloidogyne enterolobii TaxID=390850 RepID=A0ACB0XPE5_MELEN
MPEILCQHFYLHLLMLIYSLFERLSTYYLLLSTRWQNPYLFIAKALVIPLSEFLFSNCRNFYLPKAETFAYSLSALLSTLILLYINSLYELLSTNFR